MGYSGGGAIKSTDHHREYLSRTVAALTPEGHERVDAILEGLGTPFPTMRGWSVSQRLARPKPMQDARRSLMRRNRARMLSEPELGVLTVGFSNDPRPGAARRCCRLGDAVLALLKDDQPTPNDRG